MSDDFDPNVPCENYLQKLNKHYKDIKERANKKGIVAPPIVKEQPVFVVPPDIILPPLKSERINTEDDRELLKTGKYPIEGLSMKEMLPKLCWALGYNHDKVVSNSRDQKYVLMRVNLIQLLYVMYTNKMSLSRIGAVFNRDHTTVLNLIKRFDIDREATVMPPLKKLRVERTNKPASDSQRLHLARIREIAVIRRRERLGKI